MSAHRVTEAVANVELAPVQSYKDELLDYARQLCKIKLGESGLNGSGIKLDEILFRSANYCPPVGNGLVVIARYAKNTPDMRRVIVATFDFMGSDFPLRMQVRAQHPPAYYDNEFCKDRIAEIAGYFDKPQNVYAQAFPYSHGDCLSV